MGQGAPAKSQRFRECLARLQSGALRRHLLRWLFQDNLALIDFVRCQPLIHPLVCLGDGHGSGIYFVRLRPHQSDGKFWIGIILKKISTRWVDRSSD